LLFEARPEPVAALEPQFRGHLIGVSSRKENCSMRYAIVASALAAAIFVSPAHAAITAPSADVIAGADAPRAEDAKWKGKSNRGRHLGWTRGRHKGWAHSRSRHVR
jgi:hypothetical protein